MRRLNVLVVAILLAVAACGGDSADTGADGTSDEPGTTAAVTTEASSAGVGTEETTAPPTTTGSADDSEGSGPSTATVTLEGETYNFSTEGAVVAQCLTNLFGIFSIQLPMIDEGGAKAKGSVSIVALHEGTDPDVVGEVNSIDVGIGDEDWVADEASPMFENFDALQPGMSQVDTMEIDGRTVRGTATFFRQNSLFTDEVETATGTFEATCGEERTS
ncbi:MAG: hypothetical protein WBV06_09025 [Acidimicrobiia bacterium]